MYTFSQKILKNLSVKVTKKNKDYCGKIFKVKLIKKRYCFNKNFVNLGN